MTHRRNVHKVKIEVGNIMRCAEDECEESFGVLNDLRIHLKCVHGFQNIDDVEEIKMKSQEEFEEWFKAEQRKTNTAFRRSRGTRKNKNYSLTTYQCNRSGVYTPKGNGLRQLKVQGSRKLGYNCTAQIIVKNFPDHIEVLYYRQHYQHDFRLGHVSIASPVKQDVANKLTLGVNTRRIVKDFRNNAQIDNLKREDLITRRDVLNIRNEYHVPAAGMGFTFGSDLQSVNAWVATMKECVLLYKEQDSEHELLAATDFMLVIMNEQQKKMLKSFGTDRICVDSTYGITGYGFELVTLLVIDEFEEGFPAAFCCCSTVNTTSMTVFFNCVKAEIGEVNAQIFMSDDTNIFFNAWIKVFGPVGKRLLCAWHIDRAWQGHLKSISDAEKRDKVYKALKSTLYEMEEETFNQMLRNLIEDLEEDPDTQSFATYFKLYYHHRAEIWAYCYRKNAKINTNMHVEAFHKVIKHIYLEGKKTKRVDKCIDALMDFLMDKKFDRLIKFHKGKLTSKVTNALKRHNMSKSLTPKNVSDEHWEVPSSNGSNVYQVVKNPHNCDKKCVILCRFCKCCISAYHCTCSDNSILHNLCKHIHAVVSLDVGSELYTGPLFNPTPDVETPSEVSEDTCSLTSITARLSKLTAASQAKASVSRALYGPILKHVNALEKFFKMDANGKGFELLNKKEPPNKNMTPQKRLYSTKQVKKNKRLKRPSVLESENSKGALLREMYVNHGDDHNYL